MMDFTEQKKQIKKMIEEGDIVKIVEASGVSRPMYYTALKRDSIAEMSGTERKMWSACLDFVEKKIECIRQQEERTAELANKLQ